MLDKPIMVTGGCGFIGSNFIRLLDDVNSSNVIIVDKMTYASNIYNIIHLCDSKLTFLPIDIANVNEEILRYYNVHSIINFAAESHVDRSIDGPQAFIRSNVVAFQQLLDSAIQAGVKRFVQVSTDEVYGDIESPHRAFETALLRPSSPYSASKASADLLALSYVRTFNPETEIVITRCTNNIGPYQHVEKFIPRMITRALNDSPLPVFGDGLQRRDWIHVEDHCQGILSALFDGKKGEIYNFGTEREIANIEVAKMILDILGKPYSLIEYVEDRKGHDRRYAVDTRKAQKELSWNPLWSFEDALVQTVKFFVEQSRK